MTIYSIEKGSRKDTYYVMRVCKFLGMTFKNKVQDGWNYSWPMSLKEAEQYRADLIAQDEWEAQRRAERRGKK